MRAKALVASIALLAPLVTGGSGASAAARQLEPTIVVDTAGERTVESKTTLVAGRTYTIIVDGTYSETIPTSDGTPFTYFYDSVYCFEASKADAVCTRSSPQLFERGGLKARIGSAGAFAPFYRVLTPAKSAPAFHQGNVYAHDFTPAITGKLQLSVERDPRDTYRGSLDVTLHGPESPGSTGPSAGGSTPTLNDWLDGGCQGLGGSPAYRVSSRMRAVGSAAQASRRFCPDLAGGSPRWGVPSAIPALDAGDEAIVLGPPLSSTQRSVTITLETSSGDVATVLTEDDAKFRRFARRACLVVAGSKVLADSISGGGGYETSFPVDGFVSTDGIARYLLPCLLMVDDRLAKDAARTRGAVAAATASACSAREAPVRVVADSNRSRVRIRSRRNDPRPDALRVVCGRTSAGLTIRVQPVRKGVSLRSVVGSRLSVGLVRSPKGAGSARGTIAFHR